MQKGTQQQAKHRKMERKTSSWCVCQSSNFEFNNGIMKQIYKLSIAFFMFLILTWHEYTLPYLGYLFTQTGDLNQKWQNGDLESRLHWNCDDCDDVYDVIQSVHHPRTQWGRGHTNLWPDWFWRYDNIRNGMDIFFKLQNHDLQV